MEKISLIQLASEELKEKRKEEPYCDYKTCGARGTFERCYSILFRMCPFYEVKKN